MCKLSEIIGKNALSLWDASSLGKIKNAICDDGLKKITALETENGNFFPISEVIAFGPDTIVVGSYSSVLPEGLPFPINTLVYTVSGTLWGAVYDLEFKGDKIVSVLVPDNKFDGNKIVSRSDELIIVNDGNKRIIKKEGRPEEKTAPPPENQGVSLPQKLRDGVSPTKFGSYDFLIGKRVTKTIYSNDGKLVISENSVISEETIALASEHEKLVQLALYSKQ